MNQHFYLLIERNINNTTTSAMSVSLQKGLREEMVFSKANDVFYQTVVFSKWFLSKLLNFLDFIEIAKMDTAICNKFYRPIWLKCIAKYLELVPTFLKVTNDRPLRWCSNKHLRFRYLELQVKSNKRRRNFITNNGAFLISMCCLYMVELNLVTHTTQAGGFRFLLEAFGKLCLCLKKLRLDSHGLFLTDNEVIPLVSRNDELEELEITYCPNLSDKFLTKTAARCHNLRVIKFDGMDRFTDKGIIALVSRNHGLQELEFKSCHLLTDACLTAIAKHCHQLKII